LSAAPKKLFQPTGIVRRNPFGAVSPAGEPHHTATLADAVRRTRWIAIDINADKFAVFFLAQSAERNQLIFCFDSDYPVASVETRIVSAQMGDRLATLVPLTTTPAWWTDDHDIAGSSGLTALEWVQRLEPSPPGMTAIAFPVYSDRSQSGVVIFFGDQIKVERDALFEAHARSFALFSAVTRITSADKGGIPAISKREIECLRLTADGYTSDEIAEVLGLSVHTANQYVANTTQKLNAVNRIHAVAKALRLGTID